MVHRKEDRRIIRDHGPSIRNDEVYEALRDDGASKRKAARIANAQANDRRAGPYEEWTRDALYDRAKQLDIDGRSGMNKDELIDALRSR